MTTTRLADAKRLVIKVGSALVTNNGEGLDLNAINEWARQIAQLRQASREVVLVSSGAIACGMQRRELPELNWTKGEQRLPAWMVERYGYEKARRIGVVAMIGGKDKTAKRNATPEPFRDLLLSIARRAH